MGNALKRAIQNLFGNNEMRVRHFVSFLLGSFCDTLALLSLTSAKNSPSASFGANAEPAGVNASLTLSQVVMLGLDAAGKTTILYKLHIGEILTTVPTIGERTQAKRFVALPIRESVHFC